MQESLSNMLMEKARKVIPGGVNSPVRAFKAVGGTPKFIESGQGPCLYDVDGKKYIDYVGSWGALILGHAHPHVIKAIQEASLNGLSFGAPCKAEVELAELICHIMPTVEMIRMVSSGTEATMSAIRLARGYTNKQKIVKFDSCYHGHCDSLLVKSGSGILTLGIAGSVGVTEQSAEQTIVVPYNDIKAAEQVFAAYGNDIAGVIIEPIAANNNVVVPKDGFLQGLRELCDKYNSLLIFDEVITGFRVSLGGAQELYNVKADLTCLGKIIGGGMPVGAFGGRRDILEMLAPIGPVYQAGTLSGNPMAMHAGLSTLKILYENPEVYKQLHAASTEITQTIEKIAKEYDYHVTTNTIKGLFGFSFTNDTDNLTFNNFFHQMLRNGVYLAPSAYEAGFMSLAHDEQIIDSTKKSIEKSFAEINTVEFA